MRTKISVNQANQQVQVRRIYLIRERLIKNRHRSKIAARRTGLTGFVLGLASLLVVISLIIGGIFLSAILKELPDISVLERVVGPQGQMYQPILFYDRSGQDLLPGNSIADPPVEYIEFSGPTRNEGLSLLPKYLKYLMSTTASPDTTKSPIKLERHRSMTIPEILVDDLLLFNEPESDARNIRLHLLTAKATARYGEDQLISWYLNSVNYGRSVRGAGAAARYFFKKSIDQLNPGEMLVLAVISLSPEVNPARATDLFDASVKGAVSHLRELGVINDSTEQQVSSARALIQEESMDLNTQTTAFFALAREQLSEATNSISPDQGGLKVITSMDADLQTRLVCALYDMLNDPMYQTTCMGVLSVENGVLPEISAPGDLVVNFILLDPNQGQVLAMLGDYSVLGGEKRYLNPHAGTSLFTPFIYLFGLLQGMSPATVVWDTPTGLDEAMLEHYPDTYEFKGPMSVRSALSGDHLAPAAKLLNEYGRENVLNLLSGFGLDLYDSVGIPYTSGVADSLSIAQAYGILAHMGVRTGNASITEDGEVTLNLILSVLDENGTVILEQGRQQEQTLVNPALAWLVNDMLSSAGGGIQGPRGSNKTSLSPDGMDFWRVTYTPEYVFVVYMGYSDPIGKIDLDELGIDLALVNIIEDHFASGSNWDGWIVPEGITRQEVCVPSGLLPGEDCPQTSMEYFMTGTEPTRTDDLYLAYPIDMETGRLATVFTNPARITKQIFFNPPRVEVPWAKEAGYPLVPGEFAVFQSESILSGTVILAPMNFASVKGLITISGQIEPTGFASYRLDLGTGLSPTQWLQIGASMLDLPLGKMLGTLDTTRYADGLYTIRIQVLRQGNLIDNSYVVILIDNSIKQE